MISTLFVALSSALAVSALPVSHVGTVEPTVLPNATQYNASVVWYEMNGNRGACGKKNSDSDRVVGLPLEWYSQLNQVSPYCGEYVVVTNPIQNISVVAQVADASTLNNTLSVSVGTWDALNGSAVGLHEVNWRRANETEIASAKKAQSSAAPSPTSSWTAPSSATTYAASSSSKEWQAPVASSSAEHSSSWAPSSSSSAQQSTWTPSSSSAQHSTWTPSSSSSAKQSTWTPSSSHAEQSTSVWTPSSSSTSVWTPPSSTWTPSSSSWSSPAAKSSSTSTWSPEPTTTSQWTPTTTSEAPKQTQAQQQASTQSSGTYSGQATFYSQGGNPGSCGQVNGDYSMIVALNQAMVNSMGNMCGTWVTITNQDNGKTISAKIADTCPGCGPSSLDLSMGAFGALGSYDQGVLPISWSFQ